MINDRFANNFHLTFHVHYLRCVSYDERTERLVLVMKRHISAVVHNLSYANTVTADSFDLLFNDWKKDLLSILRVFLQPLDHWNVRFEKTIYIFSMVFSKRTSQPSRGWLKARAVDIHVVHLFIRCWLTITDCSWIFVFNVLFLHIDLIEWTVKHDIVTNDL